MLSIPTSPLRALGLCAVLLAAAAATPVPAAPLAPPVQSAPANAEHHVGKLVSAALVTPDLAASQRFYADLLGWTFHPVQSDGARYTEAWMNGHPVAALVHKDMPAGAHRQPVWLGFMAVRDVDAAKTTALRNGAKLLQEQRNLPGQAHEAVFADPQGAVFAVLASPLGDAPDMLAEPGAWIWSSLFTHDPDRSAAFYQTVFDYEVFSLSSATPDQHLLLASDDYARASVNALPSKNPNAHAHWINYIRVNDATQMAAKVMALGGRVLLQPRADRQGGKIAIVADPQGAAFGLLEWPTNPTQEVAQ